ncbi:MAG TPA: hypothetical protein VF297_05005 [Pyrinomonadaceae bacterium]
MNENAPATQTAEEMTPPAPRALTAEEIEQAIRDLPRHRRDLRDSLTSILKHVAGGIIILDNAPAWRQAQSVVFVSKVDVDYDSEGRTR